MRHTRVYQKCLKKKKRRKKKRQFKICNAFEQYNAIFLQGSERITFRGERERYFVRSSEVGSCNTCVHIQSVGDEKKKSKKKGHLDQSQNEPMNVFNIEKP